MVDTKICEFGGDIDEKQNPVDFERAFLRTMRASRVEKVEYVKEFELYLKHGSPADTWYAAKAPTLGEWGDFIAAFRVRFPAPKVQARTPMEYERILVELELEDAMGMTVRVEALVDGGAMVAAMDQGCYERVKDRMNGWEQSTKRLRMANGLVVPAVAQWRGKVRLQGETVEGILQVFDSGGSWEVLLGKPLLHALGVVHDFRNDSLHVQKENPFQRGLGRCVVEEKVMGVGSECTTRDKDAGVRVEPQTPGNRNVPHSEIEAASLTTAGSCLAELPFYGEPVTFESRRQMLQRIWEEDKRLQEEDRRLRELAETELQHRGEERRKMADSDQERKRAEWSRRRVKLKESARKARRT